MNSNRSEDSARSKIGPASMTDVAIDRPRNKHASTRRAHDPGSNTGPVGTDDVQAIDAPTTPLRAPNWHDREYLHALDRVLFAPMYVLIDADNESPRRVSNLDEARVALAKGEAASIAGQLRSGALGADIDPHPVQAILADVCAEILVAWCVANALPYLVRESGRPGGRHVIAIAHHRRHIREWAKLCRRLTRQHHVPIDNRTGEALRLLSAPHRRGLHAPVIGGTLTPRSIVESAPLRTKTATQQPTAKTRDTRRSISKQDHSRSGREFGLACAQARAGYTAERAWAHENLIDGKSAKLGELWWRRYIWMPAVMTASAEEGIDEDQAWLRAQHASPVGCRKMGRAHWRGLWRRAVREATTTRPRRYRIDSTGPTSEQTEAIEATSRGLRSAALAAAADRHLRPQRLRSIAILLHAIAPAIVLRDGSISSRSLAESACLDPKTVRAAMKVVLDLGVLTVARRYTGGTQDCHAYGVGVAAQAHIEEATNKTSPTSCSTPPPSGHCNPTLLRRRHTRDRHHWHLRCTALSALPPGETLATSTSPAARLLRSLWFQRTWWTSLPPAEQAARRNGRRQALLKMDATERSAWFDWLAKRELIANAADRVINGTGSAEDSQLLANAPSTIHRGMRDPLWKTTGLPRSSGRQLEFAA